MPRVLVLVLGAACLGALPVPAVPAATGASTAAEAAAPGHVATAGATSALVRRFVDEAWNRGRYEVVGEIFAPDYVVDSLNAGAPPLGRQTHAQLVAHVREFRDALPDLRMTIEEVVESGDRAYVRTRLRGTQRGPLFGMPPSNRPVEIVLAAVYRGDGRKLLGHSVLVDTFGLMQQIGALPLPPGGPGAPGPGGSALPATQAPGPAAFAPFGSSRPGAVTSATARLRLLEPGMRWVYRVAGDVRPAGAPAAMPLGGTITITIETLAFGGRDDTPVLKFAQDLKPLGAPPGTAGTMPPGPPPGGPGQSIFGAETPPVGLFWFRQDPVTRDVRFIGDNHGADGAPRAALGAGGLFMPGAWGVGIEYDKPIEWAGGGWTRNWMKVDGVETIATGLGPRAAWRAPNRSNGSEGIIIDGTDWWAPELGQPVQFDANTRLPDGTVLRIRAVLESTNVTT